MLDLDSLTGQKKKTVINAAAITLFYQSDDCRRLLQEAMQYEGMAEPRCKPSTDATITDDIVGVESPLLLLEVRRNLVDIAHQIRPLVTPVTRVVIIGREDSMTAYRAIRHLGFYYLYWPAEKLDVAAFLRDIQEDMQHNKGPQNVRRAKRVAVVGPKGGTGCTMVTCELAHGLVQESQQQVILVDHAYTCSDMHIMLGQRDLKRQPISEQAQKHHALGNILDYVGAQSQLTRINKMISYLGFEVSDGSSEELREYTNNILEPLQQDANFIIEDYSASVKFYPQPAWLCPLMDCVILVTQPTLTGLHEAKNFLDKFQRINKDTREPARLILVLNHSQPKDAVDRETLEQFLKTRVDIEIPYIRQCEELLTSGQRLLEGRNAQKVPLINLARMVIGKPVTRPGAGLLSLLKRKEKTRAKTRTRTRTRTEVKIG